VPVAGRASGIPSAAHRRVGLRQIAQGAKSLGGGEERRKQDVLQDFLLE
jgi:hypothetical protein